MVRVTVEVDEEVYEVLETLAEMQGGTVSDVLHNMVVEDLDRIKARLNDPIIGMFDSGRTDVSERDADIMYGNKSDQGS